MKGLSEFLNNNLVLQANNQLTINDDFIIPGYWAALAAYCRFNKIKFNQLAFCNEDKKNYASAIALEHALGETDSYPYKRKNSGTNYSPLVLLKNEYDIDNASQEISNCIRTIFDYTELSHFVNELCKVIGELYDNVWSHGKNTGFSMAQKWKKPYSQQEYCFEFALADCGVGFLRELQSVGMSINCDEEAIKWCIQEGNSSKKLKKTDDWQQRMPGDSIGNPMPGVGKAITSENHHQGLGLAKLINLVNNYQGQLWLTSGKSTLIVDENGRQSFKKNTLYWQGVALACRFNTQKARDYKNNYNDDEAIASISQLLRM